ncbi:amino acid ABC transporter ATP-binding protein [Pseudonocardia zijingensis]|uniref:amino acid ABC transporter ATP-binding protein n=1 Tax=Pseudonocardia zijingensis TaxID=153376 RepID=UPI00361543E7
MPVVLDVRGVRKQFGDFRALDGVDLQVHETEVVAVIGPSGSGKSTLVRCVNQLERIDGGSIHLDGELLGYEHQKGHLRELSEVRIAEQRRRTGMVFQSFNLFPHMTVLRNVVQPQVLAHGADPGEAERRARHLLDRVGLSSKVDNYPITLSGGEQQRVAIARALGPNPRIMLFDEPTSALDPELIEEVMAVLRDLAAGGRTMVVVTHDLNFAHGAADWCLFMERGQVVEQGDPRTMFAEPRTTRLRAFLARTFGPERASA